MKSIFIVPSCINFLPDQPLDYSDVRSHFSSDERFAQTLTTIGSIRKFSPTSDIMLVEISELSAEHEKILKEKCEYTIFPSTCSVPLFDHFKNHANKSHAVVFLLLQAIYTLKSLQYPVYDIFFQLSGRYKLNSGFNSENYLNNLFTAKRHTGFDSNTALSTTMFSFSREFMDEVFTNMLWSLSVTTNYLPPYAGFSFETNVLPHSFDKISFIDTLGVEGYLGPCGEFQTS